MSVDELSYIIWVGNTNTNAFAYCIDSQISYTSYIHTHTMQAKIEIAVPDILTQKKSTNSIIL